MALLGKADSCKELHKLLETDSSCHHRHSFDTAVIVLRHLASQLCPSCLAMHACSVGDLINNGCKLCTEINTFSKVTRLSDSQLVLRTEMASLVQSSAGAHRLLVLA